jgi:hypothetical protein
MEVALSAALLLTAFVGASIGIGFLAEAFSRSALAWTILSLAITPVLGSVLLLFELQWPGLIEQNPSHPRSQMALTAAGLSFGLLTVIGMTAIRAS